MIEDLLTRVWENLASRVGGPLKLRLPPDQFAFEPVEGAVRIRFEGQTPPQAAEQASEAAR